MTATLEVGGRAVSVTLRNLSSDGAQVECDSPPSEGTQLLFRKADLAISGSVIWTKGKQAGIQFDQPLDPQTVLNHVPVPRPRMKPDFRRPGLTSRALTEQERKLGERWIPVPPTPTIGDA